MARQKERTYSQQAWIIFNQVCNLEPGEERDEIIGDLVYLHADFRGQARAYLAREVELLLYYKGLNDPKSLTAWRRLGYLVPPGTQPYDRLHLTIDGRVREFDVYHHEQVLEECSETSGQVMNGA